MIHSQDRTGYFGASDTRHVMSDNRDTATWKRFWSQKLGSGEESPDTIYTRAGTLWEHPILEAINEKMVMDGQLIIEELKVRVNYDGYLDGVIYEVKTHGAGKEFKVTKPYWQQCQVEMFAYQQCSETWFLPPFKKLYIVSYALEQEDYSTEEPIVDPNKINYEEIEYDPKFAKDYVKRVTKLAKYLEKGKFPG